MLQSLFSIDHSHLAPAFRVTMPEIFFFASFTVRREIRLSAAARMISSQWISPPSSSMERMSSSACAVLVSGCEVKPDNSSSAEISS